MHFPKCKFKISKRQELGRIRREKQVLIVLVLNKFVTNHMVVEKTWRGYLKPYTCFVKQIECMECTDYFGKPIKTQFGSIFFLLIFMLE